ncbi:MAG: exopolysaccharide biosynthesis polyprenyl glycosylphosphotransferase [bacterium]|nr:exopolysaccharide biosynthesis polyprenyl glycosylphosphotransferase [bacterium]
MKRIGRKEPLLLLLGDFVFFGLSLWLSLALRNLSLPGEEYFFTHFAPFLILFIVWVAVFYISGLYEKHTTILKSRLPAKIFNTQLVNSGLAVAFFYLIPYFGITPKTILFIDLVISFILIFIWRRYIYLWLSQSKPNNAILIGAGEEMRTLLAEVNSNPIYNIRFVSSVDLDRADGEIMWGEMVEKVYEEDVSVIAIDLSHAKVVPVLPHLYNLIFSRVNFIDLHKIYEDIFDRVPFSLLRYDWFLENISTRPRGAYDAFKRLMDIIISIPLLVIPLLTYPFAAIAMKLEDGGQTFIIQDRIGRNNKLVKIVKFRSMTKNDQGEYGTEGVTELKVTKVGKFLRKTRLDEFPQLWNVLKGDISLIGPRPELPALVKNYTEEIPYYNVRHLIKPGLSGWAQIYHVEHPHHGLDTLETKNKLSYDLFYIKNRSFLLDLKIAMRTIRTLLSREGV